MLNMFLLILIPSVTPFVAVLRAFARQRTPNFESRNLVVYFIWMGAETPETYPFMIEAVKGMHFILATCLPVELQVFCRDHQNLLQLLRRLGERKELPRMEARGDDEVARPFGRALEQHRSLDLDELVTVHVAMDRLHDAMSQLERLRHLRTPQVEVAVLQAEGLVRGRLSLGRCQE